MGSDLEDLRPNVVMWEHSKEYILPGEISYLEIMEGIESDEVSRPLMTLFRIGCDVRDSESLRKLINEIKADSSERSSASKRINLNLKKYLEVVWPDFDQNIQVSLESDQMLVQIFDPNCEDPSHFQMDERSQGCQTFLSFLLTVAAESTYGVIRDTLLLLDEPETHLHPSGVRFMLAQLIDASKSCLLYTSDAADE